ncbi:hypothetical protein ElyMa_006461300 [Elysia marginata]|uniref:Uncharacterized protein n=1 Tax=Elysia marginata TaxID=1093978 RepID=A0AAV4HZA2_9GAST|nr:hypothetical protein ElyMa_006461300 [Elysia marginata]
MSSLQFALKSLDLLSLFWLLSSILIAIAHVIMHVQVKPVVSVVQTMVDFAKPLYYFGKVKQIHLKNGVSHEGSGASKLVNRFSSLPKSWFSHFYVAGFFVHSLVFLLAILLANRTVEVPGMLKEVSILLHWFDVDSEGLFLAEE